MTNGVTNVCTGPQMILVPQMIPKLDRKWLQDKKLFRLYHKWSLERTRRTEIKEMSGVAAERTPNTETATGETHTQTGYVSKRVPHS